MTARPPISGLTATQGTRRRSSAARIGSTARIGPIETYGLLGAITISSALSSASSTPGAGLRLRRPGVVERVDLVPVTSRDEPLLKRERAGRSLDERTQRVVRRGQQGALRSPRAVASLCGDLGERHTFTQELCAHEMQPEIAIAEPEPGVAAHGANGFERVPRLAGPAPAAFVVGEAGERIEDAVEVG